MNTIRLHVRAGPEALVFADAPLPPYRRAALISSFFATLRKKFAAGSRAINGTNHLEIGRRLALSSERGSRRLTYRIHRAATPEAVVFALSGDMDIEHTTRLEEFLANEADGRIILDLKDVSLVDRPAVRFLAGAEAAGIRIVNCPEYVRSWIAAERDWQQQDEPDKQEPKP